MQRPSREWAAGWITFLVIAGAVVFVFVQLAPSLIFLNTTPSGGDTGAHVWAPAYLRDHLLPHWRVTGWTPDWYAGFPAYWFYFPLPSLLIVGLGGLLPYNVAFKLVTVLGTLALPVSAYALGRLGRVRFPGPALLAVATVPFLFDRYFTIWGGNVPSTLAGEFSFSLGLAIGLLFLGVLARGLETGRHRALAALLLALTGLCHLLPTIFVLVGALVLCGQHLIGHAAGALRLRRGDQDREVHKRAAALRLGFVLTVLGVGACLAAFWSVPFVLRLPFTTNMGYERTNEYVKNLLPWLRQADPAGGFAPYVASHLKVVVALALAGSVVAVARRRRMGITILLTTLAMAAVFRFPALLPARLWNARMLPFWYLGLYFLAALAVSEGALAVGALFARSPDRPSAIPGLVTPVFGAALALGFVGSTLGVLPQPIASLNAAPARQSFIPAWVRWNETGYQGKAAWPEYRSVVAMMGDVGRRTGCGRAMYEYEAEQDRLGTPLALMLLPYWTRGCIGSMEGLYFESSATTPYHFLNAAELSKAPSNPERNLPYKTLDVADGVRHLQLMGARYYMAFSPAALAQAHADPDLHLVAVSKPWEIFEVAGSAVVAPLHNQPAVLKGVPKGGKGWLDVAVSFFQSPDTWDVPLAASGPGGWQRIGVRKTSVQTTCPNDSNKRCPDKTAGAGVSIQQPLRIPVRATRVSGIRTRDDRISFDVDRPGSPVLVKASYFPNWQASGARGPWRVTPNLMVVIPTSRHVSLHYGYTPVDRAGWAFTLLGALLVVTFWRKGPLPFPEPEREAEQLQLFDAELDMLSVANGERALVSEPPPP
ncbi:MAG TPA: 6-pyruvoyl-tetrahydropterin synthase-related protein [Acidimicrobiales bacterium]|nr:6-pyruvoyl-tetrahydropterin synthase-related protein [Acidimicrobiales bacterium]